MYDSTEQKMKEMIPQHMWGAVRRWVDQGIEGGSFLMAVMNNDFMGAVSKADDSNILCLKQWAMFVYNDLPSGCWGSEEKCNSWTQKGGMRGIDELLKSNGGENEQSF